MAEEQNNTCGFPPRNWSTIWSDPLYKDPDIVLRPIWLLICTVGNVFNIILLTKIHSMQASFLVAIACSDMLYMWAWIPLYARDRIGAKVIDHKPDQYSIWGALTIFEFIGNAAAQTSDWILVIFSITRFRSLVLPLRFLNMITVTRTRVTITVVCLAATITNIRNPIEYFTKTKPPLKWMTKWTDVDEIASIVIPLLTFLVILVLNSVILWVIISRHFLSTKKIGPDQCGHQPNWVNLSNTNRKTSKFTEQAWTAIHLLMASVALYLVSRIPFIAWQIILQLEKRCRMQLSDHQAAIFLPFYYQCLYMNYSLNFVVYCGVSRKYFRSAVKLIPRWARCKFQEEKPKDSTLASRMTTNTELEL